MAGGEDHCWVWTDELPHAIAPEVKSVADTTRAIIDLKYFITKQYPFRPVFVNRN
jgi:hypothetical protein